jgi:LysM repeat protein
MSEEIQLSGFGKIGFMCLTILLILLLGATMGIIIASKTRIIDLEDRVVKLEAIDRIAHIREQAKAFEQLKERFDKLEASMSLSTEHIAKSLDSLPAKMAEEIPQKSEFPRSSKVPKRMSKKHYHTVSAGETLYRISRRYGLTVKKIRLLNKLSDRFVIYPGQKLLVTL